LVGVSHRRGVVCKGRFEKLLLGVFIGPEGGWSPEELEMLK